MWRLAASTNETAMKRIGNLFPQFVSFSNLYLAWKKARRGAHGKAQATAFEFHLETRLFDLQDRLSSGQWAPHPYRYFEIHDPKRRTISVADFEDRVVHHALVNVLEPVFERCFISDSYATRKGKGVHAAVLRAQTMLRSADWFFKSDVEKCFDTIGQDTLLGLLEHKIKDAPLLLLTEKIVRNGGVSGRGLPIGNLTSQFLANVYLNPFDHFAKEQLGAKGYVRYMDDFVLFESDKTLLKKWRDQSRGFLKETLGLDLKPSATYFNSAQNGLSFLGRRIFPSIIRLHPENCRRMLRRLKRCEHAFEKGKVTEQSMQATANSYQALLAFHPTWQLRTRIWHGT